MVSGLYLEVSSSTFSHDSHVVSCKSCKEDLKRLFAHLDADRVRPALFPDIFRSRSWELGLTLGRSRDLRSTSRRMGQYRLIPEYGPEYVPRLASNNLG